MSEWRKKLPPVPEADVYDMLSGAPFKAFAADIKKNGLQRLITVYTSVTGEERLLDGRNRMEALEHNGEDLFTKGGKLRAEWRDEGVTGEVDFAKFVTSANAHRRHLTPEQYRAALEIRRNPDHSNVRIAAAAEVGEATVRRARKKMEVGSSPLTTPAKRVGMDGVRQAAKQKKPEKNLKSRQIVKADEESLAAESVQGWTNRAMVAAQYARYENLSKVPKDKKYRKLVVDTIEAWTAVLRAIDKN